MKKLIWIFLVFILITGELGSARAQSIWVRHPMAHRSEFESQIFRVGSAESFADAFPFDEDYKAAKDSLTRLFDQAVSDRSLGNFIGEKKKLQKITNQVSSYDWDDEARSVVAQSFLWLADLETSIGEKTKLIKMAKSQFIDLKTLSTDLAKPTLLLMGSRESNPTLQKFRFRESDLKFEKLLVNGKVFEVNREQVISVPLGKHRFTFIANDILPQSRLLHSENLSEWIPEAISMFNDCKTEQVTFKNTVINTYGGSFCNKKDQMITAAVKVTAAQPLAKSLMATEINSDQKTTWFWMGGIALTFLVMQKMQMKKQGPHLVPTETSQ